MLKISWNPPLEGVRVEPNRAVLTAWYAQMAKAGETEFKTEHAKPGTGIHHSGLPNRSSRAFHYPATQSGTLMKGTKSRANSLRGEIWTNVFYAKFLLGTAHMAPRKSYYDALSWVVGKDNGRGLSNYLEWKG